MKKLMIAAAAAAMIGGAQAYNGLLGYDDAAYTVSVKGKGQTYCQAASKKVNKSITISKDVIAYLDYDQDAVYTSLTNKFVEETVCGYDSVTNVKYSTTSVKTTCGVKLLFTNKVSFTGIQQQYKEKMESGSYDFLMIKKGDVVSNAVIVTGTDANGKAAKYCKVGVIANLVIDDFVEKVGEKSRKLAANIDFKMSETREGIFEGAGAGSWKLVKGNDKKGIADAEYVNRLSGNMIGDMMYGTFNLAFSSKYTKLVADNSFEAIIAQWAKDKKATVVDTIKFDELAE